MNNDWIVSEIVLRNFKSCNDGKIVLQYKNHGWCLRNGKSFYHRASLCDAAKVAYDILNRNIEEITFVDSLTIELYSHVRKEIIRVPCMQEFSEQQILENLSKALQLPFKGTNKTVYEIAHIVTQYLEEHTDDQFTVNFPVGKSMYHQVTLKKGQSFDQNFKRLCGYIPIHEQLDTY